MVFQLTPTRLPRINAMRFETVDEVVFAEPGDMSLLGVRAIEGFGVMVDNVAHRFVATTTIVALAAPTAPWKAGPLIRSSVRT